MGSPTEFAEHWDVLDEQDLHAILIIVADERTGQISPKLVEFLRAALEFELKHRDELASKPTLLPNFDAWSDAETADAYMCCCAIERASDVGSEVLQEWASLLMHSVCLEMSTRLTVRQMMGPDPCRN